MSVVRDLPNSSVQTERARTEREWVARCLYLDRTVGQFVWHGHPRRISPNAVLVFDLLRAHPGAHYSVWEILAAVWGPTSTISPATVWRCLRELRTIPAIEERIRRDPRTGWWWQPFV
jgi:DNA-binding response OmpR family regulator